MPSCGEAQGAGQEQVARDATFWALTWNWLAGILRGGQMARKRRGPVGGTFVDHWDAQRAESVLKAANVDVSLEPVTDILCPGAVRRHGYMLVVSSTDRARAIRVLKEQGFARFVE
jgi:hypothetical protein